MSIEQSSVQVQQSLDILSGSVRDIPSFERHHQTDANNQQTASSAFYQSSPAPAPELSDADIRSPLKEVTRSSKGNQEVAEQEQPEEQEESSENGEKLNEYVAKILDKLVKQRSKIDKMSSTLDKKGLLPEKRTAQELELNTTQDDAEEGVEDGSAKENLSPSVRSKPSIPVQDLKNLLTGSALQKSAPKFNLEDVLQVSRTELYYGTRFPGQVVEEHLDIVNNSGHDFVVQIIVSCLNDELLETDEYVYSVRRSHLYDYNDKHYLIMAPYSCASFKFALKVPNMRISGKIQGQVKVSIQGLTGAYTLNLSADVSIPKIYCPKELKCHGIEYPVIKLAVKDGKKAEMKIPFRNAGNVPVTLELEFHDPKDSAQERPLFDCLVHPNVITINPNSTTLASVLIKPWKVVGGMKGLDKPKPSRKILVGRVRDSALVYSFVFWVELY